jgi:eukaryotic-like serine/threonine-protein kinase
VRPPTNAGPLTPALLNLLRADPADRPTMREAHAELAALAAQRTVPAGPPVADPQRAWTKPVAQPVPRLSQPTAIAAPPANLANATQLAARPRRRPARLALVIAVVVLAVGVTLVVIDRKGTKVAASNPAVVPPVATQPVTVAPAEDDHAPTFAAMSDLLNHYYNLLPANVDEAYRLLSAGYRLAHPLGAVRTFYAGIRLVTVSNVEPAGSGMVRAVITFVTRHGVTTHEPYRFTIVRRHGTLIIDNAVQLDAPGT